MSPELQAAQALRHLALDETVKDYLLNNPPLYQTLLKAAMRFIAGENLEQCTAIARDINGQGHAVTIDFMGESTRDAAMAEAATLEFLAVVQTIAQHQLKASVSLDLSHLGMVIDPQLGYTNAVRIAEAAQQNGLEVIISAEGPDRTDTVLDIHGKLCQRFDNVGITLQAYLLRTPGDLEQVLERPGKLRIVKGAFAAEEGISWPRSAQLNQVYLGLLERAISSGHSLSIATHDPQILQAATTLLGGPKPQVEFEMLKGVTPEQLQAMRGQGYVTRMYLPYGLEWHLYLCNRLAENPPNVYQALSDMFAPGVA